MALRAAVASLRPGEHVLDAALSRYLVRVHRLRRGDAFLAFDVDGGVEADARVVEADPRRARVEIGPLRSARVSAPLPVVLLWALGKGDKPEQVIRDATALGAKRLVLVDTERSVPRLGERADARRERWRLVAREAARQSGRGDVPEIEGPLELAAALAGSARGVVLDPGADRPLVELLAGWDGVSELSVLIGPEGGLDPDEIRAAEAAGLTPVRFGSLTLRTETAVVAVLGVLLGYRDGRPIM